MCLKTCLEVMNLMEVRFPSARHTRSVLLKILRNNNIMLDEDLPEESPRSLDGEGDAAWRSLMDVPAFPLPSDLDWLYPANHTFNHPEFLLPGASSFDPGMGLPQDFNAPAQYDNFPGPGLVDTRAQAIDLSGVASDAPVLSQGMTPNWTQSSM